MANENYMSDFGRNNYYGVDLGLASNLATPSQGTYVGPYNKSILNALGNPTTTPKLNELNIGGSDGFLSSIGGMKGLMDGAGALSSLASAYAGFKQLGLAEDAFNFNKAMKEKEYAMAKDAYDRNVKRATSIGDQMRAGSVTGA